MIFVANVTRESQLLFTWKTYFLSNNLYSSTGEIFVFGNISCMDSNIKNKNKKL